MVKLNKFLPPQDKLKHNFVGNLGYAFVLLLSVIFHFQFWWASIVVFVFSFLWEIFTKKKSKNSTNEQLLDIFWSNVTHVIITILISILC